MAHDWPALAIACILLVYWARVLRLARKARRRRGSLLGGNFIPAERTGRLLRLIWNPVVALWIALPLMVFLAGRPPGFLRPLWRAPAVAWIAVAVAAAAFGFTWICWQRMGKSWRMGIDPGERTELVVSGPYAYVRHPIYGLSALLMLCTVLVVPAPATIAVATAHLLLLRWEAAREEKHLAALHGSAYLDYASRTGRFVPVGLSPYRATSRQNTDA